jgi:predicted phosphodiesterase
MRIVAISDTHGFHRSLQIPDGDVLVHAGDCTRYGRLAEVDDLNDWLGSLPHRHKIVIAGNHDSCFERDRDAAETLLTNATYLQDSAITLDGLHFYGSPWQPEFQQWSFNLPRGEPLREKWLMIPVETDVLITHGPPHGILDQIHDFQHAGCEELLAAVERLRPRVHIFGHIHEGAGVAERGPTRFINASSCTFRYEPANPPRVIDL